MIGHVGMSALGAGLIAAVASALLWLRVALSGASARPARLATWSLFAAAALTCGMLEWALLTHDFSVRYVAENGGRDVPLYFTITTLWAALDGSLLLWLLILGAFAVLLGRKKPRRAGSLHPWAMTVICVLAVYFFALTFFAANPFRAVHPVPVDGPGPNPLLREHPAMGLHPPLLYAGYIGLVVPFAFAVAALLVGRADAEWATITRRWALIAWTFLTAGIVLGAWWSYAVLGWGGYWAWDPVENASLMPWLTATAAVHTTLARARPGLTGWAVTLYSASFLLVLIGTFLTRSGAVESVHSFTQSPLGPMLLGFVLLVATGVLGLLAWRSGRWGAGRSGAGGSGAAPVSQETAVLGNGVLLVVLAAVVLTGTLFPLIAEAFSGVRASVGPAYFTRTAIPVALVVLVLMGTAPLIRRGADSLPALARRLAIPAAAGLATVAIVGLLSRPGVPALIAFGLAAYVLTGIVRLLVLEKRRRRFGGLLAHAGIAVAAVGIAASSAYTVSAEREVALGEAVSAGGVSARLSEVRRTAAGDSMGATVRIVLERDGEVIGSTHPQLRFYPARDMTVSVPGIWSRPAADVYTTVTGVELDGTKATLRLAVNPLVSLLWAGGGLTAAGGALALFRWPRRREPPTKAAPVADPVAAGEVSAR